MQESEIPLSECAGIFVTTRGSQINYCCTTFQFAGGIDSKESVLSEQYFQVGVSINALFHTKTFLYMNILIFSGAFHASVPFCSRILLTVASNLIFKSLVLDCECRKYLMFFNAVFVLSSSLSIN